MSSFKDNAGKDWAIRLDGPKIREVRDACDVELSPAKADGDLFKRLAEDDRTLVDILWVLCRDQAGEIDEEQFAERLFGDPIELAADALMEAYIRSFPQRKRSLLRSLWQKQAAVIAKGMELAEAKLNDPNLDAQLEAKMTAALNELLANVLSIGATPATSGPEKSESAHTV